jgi:hypothetical protein
MFTATITAAATGQLGAAYGVSRDIIAPMRTSLHETLPPATLTKASSTLTITASAATGSVSSISINASNILAPLFPPSEWATATIYEVGNVITQSGTIYRCVSAHTAGTFSADLAASKWVAWTSSVTGTGTTNATATAIAAKLNEATGFNGGFSATASGSNVTLRSPAGSQYNALTPQVTVSGTGLTIGAASPLSGGGGIEPSLLFLETDINIPTDVHRLKLLAVRSDRASKIWTNEDEGLIEFTSEGSFLWPIGANPLEGTNGDPLTNESNGAITRLTFENHDPLNTANVQLDALIDTTPSTTP